MAKTVKNQLPSAWVVSSKDRGRKKIKKGNIYLNDKEEFEIELHNPTNKNVLAVINLDGKAICSSGLIVRRGERIYLDCFIDDKKKFMFETYLVDNTKESKAATAGNGKLEVFFYNEKDSYRYTPPKPTYFNSRSLFADQNTAVCADTVTFDASSVLRGSSTSGAEYCNTCTTDGLGFSSLTGSLDMDMMDSISKSVNTSSVSSIETGQISKGDDSLQNFVEVDMEFESSILTRLTYTLLPESRRPRSKKELKNASSVAGKYDELMKIKELLDAGAINGLEYDSAKAELMA